MNAYELAHYMEADFQMQEGVIDMLRQQADRIAELEKDLKYFTNPCDPMCKPSICDCYKARFAINNRRTLTDEEIADMVCSGEYWELSEGQVIIAVHFDKFARAILKKASEK